MLREQADCYEKILSEIRYETEYFYVGFYGLGFPEFLRNKAFIYRGNRNPENEKFSRQNSSIVTWHPELFEPLTASYLCEILQI